MEKDISVKVSREGNITMTVPETVNPLTYEEANLLSGLLAGAMDDSKRLRKLWMEGDSVLKPYNSTGRKISEVASKVRPIPEGAEIPPEVVNGD